MDTHTQVCVCVPSAIALVCVRVNFPLAEAAKQQQIRFHEQQTKNKNRHEIQQRRTSERTHSRTTQQSATTTTIIYLAILFLLFFMQQQRSLVFVGARFKLWSVTRGVCLELMLADARTLALLHYTLTISFICCLIRNAHPIKQCETVHHQQEDSV